MHRQPAALQSTPDQASTCGMYVDVSAVLQGHGQLQEQHLGQTLSR
jgi:hypothetical protein